MGRVVMELVHIEGAPWLVLYLGGRVLALLEAGRC